MRLSHNLASLNIYKEQTKNIKLQSKAMGRISSGIKVNNSAQGADTIAQSEKLRMQIRGMQMAQRNSQDGMSMLQTAEGALDTTTQMLQRIRELSVQAGGANTTEDNVVIQNEIKQMISGINDTVNNNEFNGVKLLNNTVGSPLNMMVGANVDETTKIPKFDLTSANLGDSATGMVLDKIDVTKPGGVDEALKITDNAIGIVLSARSKYGALENRFEITYDRSAEIGDTIQTAESSLRDADISEEMVEVSRTGILIEAGNALMAQTNRFPQDMLRILENVRK